MIGYGLAGILVNAGVIDRNGSYPFQLIALVTWLPRRSRCSWPSAGTRRPWLPAAGFAASMFLLVFIARVFQTSYLIYPLVGIAIATVAAARPAERA